jgi:phosphoserine/homoserine phosphotransferase
VNAEGIITGYNLRQKDSKRMAVDALKSLNYEVYAFGDSYNDVSMLKEADKAILFRPPQNVIDDYPEFTVMHDYSEMKNYLAEHFG